MKFDKNMDFNSWTLGRIFNSETELIWHYQADTDFHVVYSGLEPNGLTELQKEDVTNWISVESESYFLWGRQYKSGKDQSETYIELQIPRLLRYPIISKKEKARAVLKVVHYIDKSTGVIKHFRFKSLEESR